MSTRDSDPSELPLTAPLPPKPHRQRRSYRRWLKVLPLVLVAGAVGYVRFVKPIDVQTARVTRGELVTGAFGRGTVESRREAQLGFDLAGRLSDIQVDEGDRVKLGQVLAHLSPEQYDAELRTAASGANLAHAAMGRLEAEQRRAEATLSFAESEEQRARTLASTGVVSARDLDLAVQQLALAKAERDRVRAAHAEAARGIEVASGSVQQRRAVSMRTALVSPFDGLVIRRFRDPGDTVAVGATVLRVVATDRLWVRAWVDEGALVQLKEGQPAQVSFPGDASHAYIGKVDRIGREADRQTHELLVDVAMDTLPERIAIGQRADVRIELSRTPEVARLASSFIQREGSAAFCYVDRGGRIARVPVVVGRTDQGWVEIVSGMAEGDLALAPTTQGASLATGRRWRPAGAT